MKNIVTSLDISTKLCDLGVKQESIWCWFPTDDLLDQDAPGYKLVNDGNNPIRKEFLESHNLISAFVVEELFDILPFEFFRDETRKFMSYNEEIAQEKEFVIKHRYTLKLQKIPASHDYWYCWATGRAYDNFGLAVCETSFSEGDNSAANAAAKMLIYLIENKLIELPED